MKINTAGLLKFLSFLTFMVCVPSYGDTGTDKCVKQLMGATEKRGGSQKDLEMLCGLSKLRLDGIADKKGGVLACTDSMDKANRFSITVLGSSVLIGKDEFKIDKWNSDELTFSSRNFSKKAQGFVNFKGIIIPLGGAGRLVVVFDDKSKEPIFTDFSCQEANR